MKVLLFSLTCLLNALPAFARDRDDCQWSVVSVTPQQTCTNYAQTCTSEQVLVSSWQDIVEVNSCTGATQTVRGGEQDSCAAAPARDEYGHGICG